jgi:tetratricopeptide (TPR) repeat protein
MNQPSVAFRLFLFGPFTVLSPEGVDLTPKSRKSCAILAMLAVAPRGSRSRLWLRDKLWSDRGEEQASASLRQALLDIRQALGPAASAAVSADKNTVSLDLAAVEVDALMLLDPALGQSALPETEHFLEGIDVRDPEFEEWLTLERQSWLARIEQAGYAHQLEPKTALGRSTARPVVRGASAGAPPPARAAGPGTPSGSSGNSGDWRIALMPPVVIGGEVAAQLLQSSVQRSLVAALVETGDQRVIDLTPHPFGGALTGPLAQLPDQVHLSVQLRVFADPVTVRLAIVLLDPADNSVVWSDEVAASRSEAAEVHFAMPLVVRATDAALRHFLARTDRDTAEAEGRIAAAVVSMFRLTRPDLDRSEAILRRHLALNPTGTGYAWLAFLMTFRIGQRFSAQDAPLLEEAQALARRAMELEPTNALVAALVGHIHSYLFGEFDYAAGLFERSLRVNPAQTLAWDLYAMLHAYAGQPKKAFAMAQWARHLGAFSPHRYYYETTRAITGNFSGDHLSAIAAGTEALAERPDFNSLLRVLVSSHAHLDRPDEARALLDRLLQVEPNFSIGSLREAGYPGLDTEGGRRFVDGLIKAGVRPH